MPRYGVFEIRTTCGKCGHPVPINGPFRNIICTGCFANVSISAETYGDFLNKFENEYQNFNEAEGMGGTVMGGDGTYKYSYYKLSPRCWNCKTGLPEASLKTDGKLLCRKCGFEHEIFPVPEWLKEVVPSAVQCICSERELNDKKGETGIESGGKPVAMSCIRCGGSLEVTGYSERIMKCRYCGIDVYIPDPVWLRLHPVEKTQEWYVRFEGETMLEIEKMIRAEDLREEKKALKEWKKKQTRIPSLNWIRTALIAAGIFTLIVVLVFSVMYFLGYSGEEIGNTLDVVISAFIILFFAGITLWGVFHMEIAMRFTSAGKCKKEMTRLADMNGWKHEGIEYRLYMGYVNDKVQGRDFELSPDNDYALEVELDESPFYLKTEPPGYPHEGVRRFSTGDPFFDGLFPIRYAKPEIINKMNKYSPQSKSEVLEPLYRFLDQWKGKLARMKIDGSDLSLHLKPGHEETMLCLIRFLIPEDIEPLLEDTIKLARALDDIGRGRQPETI